MAPYLLRSHNSAPFSFVKAVFVVAVIALLFFASPMAQAQSGSPYGWKADGGNLKGDCWVPPGGYLTCGSAAAACQSYVGTGGQTGALGAYAYLVVTGPGYYQPTSFTYISGLTCVILGITVYTENMGVYLPPGSCGDSNTMQGYTPCGDEMVIKRIGGSYGCSCKGQADASVTVNSMGDPFAGEPINIATGNMAYSTVDYSTAGANPLSFARYYNSRGTYVGALGVNWRSTYDRFIATSSATQVEAQRPDGQLLIFNLTGGVWTPDSDVDYTLANQGSTWTLTAPDDSVETYVVATSGYNHYFGARLASIQSRNGYTQTLSYNAIGYLASVTDSYSRTLTFSYGSGNDITAIATPDGTTLSYGYTEVGTGYNLTSVSFPASPAQVIAYVYGNASMPSALTGVIDENGNQYLSWTYDSYGRALTSQVGSGANAAITTVAYNDTTGSRAVTNPLGVTDTYSFATLQNAPRVTQINRAATATTAATTKNFAYDGNGYLATATDWNANKTTYLNNAHGDPTSITEASGSSAARTTTIVYDSTFVHLPDSIATNGVTAAFTYDSHENPLTKTLTDTTATIVPYSTNGQTRQWSYSWGNFLLASATSPNGNTTSFTYDGSGALVQTTNALGQTVNVTQHTGGGLPQIIVDANGVTNSLSYDARQRLTSSTLHTGAGLLTTAFTYDKAGNLTQTQLPDGSALNSTYDTAHRLTSISDSLNNQIQYTLDALGDHTATQFLNPSNVAQRSLSATFDALGRILQNIGGVGQTTTLTYDNNGNALNVTDPLNHTSQQAFDGLNRLSRVIDAMSGITKATYDQHDRPVTFVDPNSGSTTYVYNGFGDVIQRISPDTGTTKYYYDSDANLIQMIDGRGVVTNYSYDPLDRIATTTFPGDSAENVAYTYDQSGHGFGVGRLTSLADAAGSLSRTYDERGNILSEQRVSGTTTLATIYTYDNASRLASVSYPSGTSVSYARDAAGRIQSISATPPGTAGASPVVSGVTWQPFGPLAGLTFGNGITETRSFDPDYRLTNLADSGNAAVQNLAYNYDAADNVLGITDGVTSSNSQSFGYDALNHLTSATGAYGTQAYTYSAIGNRLTQTVNGAASSYTYAAHSNQLTKITTGAATQTIAYTGAGNIASVTPSTGTLTAITYNQANRLSSVTGTPVAITGMLYDAFGHRISKTSGGTTNLFSYGQSGELLEENDNGSQIDYVYLDNHPIAEIIPSTGKLYFLHEDRLGTPQLATDSSQNAAWSTAYQPFGQTTVPTGTISQNLRFPGQYADAETAWNQNGFRDYVPGLGRYLESDPIGIEGGSNSYAYALSNPTNVIDSLGLQALPSEPPPVIVSPAPQATAQILEFPAISPAQSAGFGVVFARLVGVLGVLWPTEMSDSPAYVPSSPDIQQLQRFKDLSLNQNGANPNCSPNLASPQRTAHILRGDQTGGGHRFPGLPGKTSFPPSWDDNKIMEAISDVATDPNSTRIVGANGNTIVTGIRDGINIRVIVNPSGSEIISGYPTNPR